MALYKQLTLNDFRDMMADYDFSYDGLEQLYDYLDEIEEGIINPKDIDMIYAELSVEDICQDYSDNLDDETLEQWEEEELDDEDIAGLILENIWHLSIGKEDTYIVRTNEI